MHDAVYSPQQRQWSCMSACMGLSPIGLHETSCGPPAQQHPVLTPHDCNHGMQVMKEDDNNWPEPDRVGRQELECIVGDDHVSYTCTKLGSVLQVQQSKDPEGLRIFYYLVQVRAALRLSSPSISKARLKCMCAWTSALAESSAHVRPLHGWLFPRPLSLQYLLLFCYPSHTFATTCTFRTSSALFSQSSRRTSRSSPSL